MYYVAIFVSTTMIFSSLRGCYGGASKHYKVFEKLDEDQVSSRIVTMPPLENMKIINCGKLIHPHQPCKFITIDYITIDALLQPQAFVTTSL